jgi:hypothetical protein
MKNLYAVVLKRNESKPVIIDVGDVTSSMTVLAGGSRKFCKNWLNENWTHCDQCGQYTEFSNIEIMEPFYVCNDCARK